MVAATLQAHRIIHMEGTVPYGGICVCAAVSLSGK